MAERRTATVRAPATAANLGPGFDAFGLALKRYDEVSATVTGSGLSVEVSGEGAADLPRDESHLVVRALRATYDRLGVEQPAGLSLRCRNRLPHGRGLGSSAAAIVSGVRLAQALAGVSMPPDDELAAASGLEGHPDNVAACLLGGLTIAWAGEGGVAATRLDVHPDVAPTIFVPPDAVPTELARSLLPQTVTHRDAAANAGRAGLLVAALTQQPDLLLDATEDRLHQRYREAAMPDSLRLVQALRGAGVAAVVSGAGPAVLALGTTRRPVDIHRWLPTGWEGLALRVAGDGATVG